MLLGVCRAFGLHVVPIVRSRVPEAADRLARAARDLRHEARDVSRTVGIKSPGECLGGEDHGRAEWGRGRCAYCKAMTPLRRTPVCIIIPINRVWNGRPGSARPVRGKTHGRERSVRGSRPPRYKNVEISRLFFPPFASVGGTILQRGFRLLTADLPNLRGVGFDKPFVSCKLSCRRLSYDKPPFLEHIERGALSYLGCIPVPRTYGSNANGRGLELPGRGRVLLCVSGARGCAPGRYRTPPSRQFISMVASSARETVLSGRMKRVPVSSTTPPMTCWSSAQIMLGCAHVSTSAQSGML